MIALELIDSLKKETQEIIDFCEKELSGLSEDQLLNRPNPSRWSVLECLEHMNLSSGHYIKRLGKAIPKAISKNQGFNAHFHPGYFGNKFSIGMLPNENNQLTNSMKTFFFFEPKKAPVKRMEAFNEFLTMQYETIRLLELSKKIDLNKNKIVSTLGPVLIFKAGDAFRFAIAHNIRHMRQVKMILS